MYGHIHSAIDEMVSFYAPQAKTCSDLIKAPRPLGLSLADRTCLALGITHKVPLYTTEKTLKKLRSVLRLGLKSLLGMTEKGEPVHDEKQALRGY